MRAFFVFCTKCIFLFLSVNAFWLVSPADAQLSNHSSPALSPLITEPLDESRVTTLRGNTHPLARPEFDLGTADGSLPMKRMLLVLKRSDDQEAALRKLLDDQQDKHSPNYHKWLTPEKFGQQFGPADADMQTIAGWLQSHGFEVGSTKGRTVLEFSGTAAQVEEAFHTTIHKYLVNGEQHWANATDPRIPAALTPAVAGIFTLHDFLKKPQVQVATEQFTAMAVQKAHPLFTGTNGHALAPADYYTIYNFNPLGSHSSTIAIVGRTNINVQDVASFHYWMYDQALSPNVVVNGTDPGDLGGGEETEAVLDTTWAGAVAPSNTVTLVVSQTTTTTDGADLSEAYIVDNNLADVMSESFGNCEQNYTTAEEAGVVSLAQQAAAQGITYVVAAGDSGSAGCDDPNTQRTATHGLSVNMLASTPYNVAVGGTVFTENGKDSTYWQSTNGQGTQESAISYIPEDVWNDSCLQSCTKPNIWAGGGGKSVFFSKPSWQAGVTGIPPDGVRDLPDVSLTAAPHDPYLLCLRGSCTPNTQGYISFYGVGGTSASAPAFAGILSLVANQTLSRLGQPNYVLYRLAAVENLTPCNASSGTLPAGSCVFNDVTIGNNAVPGEVNYGTNKETYQSGKGYDLATGLGSVNVTNLINQWNTVSFSPTQTTFSISPLTAVHGSPFNVSGNVTPNSGTGIPTGSVWLNGGPAHGNLVGDSTIDLFSLGSQGSYSGVTHLLPGGTYQVNAHYAGDGTYAASDSSPSVQVTIQPENTTTTFSVLTTDANGNLVPFGAGPYGTPVYYQAHVAGQSGYGTPSSYVNFWDTNGIGAGSAYLDSKGNALTPLNNQIVAGAHSITAGYSGDNSFNSSDDLTPVNFTISQLHTSTALTSQRTAQALILTATVSASGIGAPATGIVTFSSGGTSLGTSQLTPGNTANGTTQAIATLNGTGLPPGQYNVTASYPGDPNYTASTSSTLSLNLTADFSVANQGIPSQTVTAGTTASYINDIVLTPFFGFSSKVTVSCTVPAPDTTCAVTPGSYPLSNGIGIGTLSVTTQARSTAFQGNHGTRLPLQPSIWIGSVVAMLFFAITTNSVSRRHGRFIAAPLFLLLLLGGCGGGGGAGGGGSPTTGTAAGSYVITVTAAAGSLTHTTTLTLVVQ